MPKFTGDVHRRATVEHFVSNVNEDEFKTRWVLDDQGVEALYTEVYHQHAPKSINGNTLLKQFESGNRFHPFGCSALDMLLQGGLRQGQVVELYGDSGSGKTQLCLKACAQAAASGTHVAYIDTSNAFTFKRFFRLFNGIGNRRVEAQCAVDRVTVYRAYNAPTVLEVLDRLLAQCAGASAHKDSKTSAVGKPGATLEADKTALPELVILDSLGAVMIPVLGGKTNLQGHAVLAAVASLLKQVALHLPAAVLVTNHMVGGGGRQGPGVLNSKRPALGESWANQAHLRVQLSLPNYNNGPYTATLRASTWTAAELAASYWLTNDGGPSDAPENVEKSKNQV